MRYSLQLRGSLAVQAGPLLLLLGYNAGRACYGHELGLLGLDEAHSHWKELRKLRG